MVRCAVVYERVLVSCSTKDGYQILKYKAKRGNAKLYLSFWIGDMLSAAGLIELVALSVLYLKRTAMVYGPIVCRGRMQCCSFWW